ncbi:MAG: CCA tRNA nucleotidyltransferase [Suipraeoptans sp.]
MKIEMPKKVNLIIDQLSKNGYEAFAVGGCVRDKILGRIPEDWDITTSAQPLEVKHIFKRTVDTGIEHGTVTVLIGDEGFEVTTYRIDGEYEDSRHPTSVSYTRSLREDLLRRDFTINAMAYNNEEGLVDEFEGLKDINNKVIRCVGDAKSRLSEDSLRILRGVRFAAQLNFTIEENTQQAMRELAPRLKNISEERIQVELIKMVTSNYPERITEAYNLGITKEFIPEFDDMMKTKQETPHHMYNVGQHTICALKNVRNDKILRLTMLFHDMGKPEYKTMDEDGVAHFKKHAIGSEELARKVMNRLKFDNETKRKVMKLVFYHDYRMPATAVNVRRAMNKIGTDLFPLYLEVRRADTLAQSTYLREEKLANINEIEELYKEIVINRECVQVGDLSLNGKDLIALGAKQGRQIGDILKYLLEIVIENPEKNTKEELTKEVKDKFFYF